MTQESVYEMNADIIVVRFNRTLSVSYLVGQKHVIKAQTLKQTQIPLIELKNVGNFALANLWGSIGHFYGPLVRKQYSFLGKTSLYTDEFN